MWTHRYEQDDGCNGMRHVEEMIVHLSHAAQGEKEKDVHAAERDATPAMVGLHVRRDTSFVGPFSNYSGEDQMVNSSYAAMDSQYANA